MISVIIPNYNRRDSTLKLLGDVFSQLDSNFEVIVVDDKSTDDSVEAIKREFPSVDLIVNETNSGPAVSRNKGIQKAKGTIIVGFDSDVTVPDQHCLKKVEESFNEKSEIDGQAFRLLQPNGKTDDFARWWHPVPVKDYFNKCFETNYFSGTGYAFRTKALLESGLYPEILYMHYEEVELALRFIDSGYKLIYNPRIEVIHHEGQVSRRSEIKSFYKNRNQILIAIALMPWPRAMSYTIPRITFGFFTAIRDRHLPSYFRMLKSAKELGAKRLKNRSPLKRSTWIYLKLVKKGILVD